MSGHPQWYGVKRDPDLADDGEELQVERGGVAGAGAAVARPESSAGGPAAGGFHQVQQQQAHGPALALSAHPGPGQQRRQRPGPALQQEHQATMVPRRRSTAHHQPPEPTGMQPGQLAPQHQHQQQLHQQLIHPPFALVTPPADATTPSQAHLQYFQHHHHHHHLQQQHQQQHQNQQQQLVVHQQNLPQPPQTAISENHPPPGPGPSLCHPHDPRLVQPHQQQQQQQQHQQHVRAPDYFPHDHDHDAEADAAAAAFPPSHVHVDNTQYFPTPLDHPDHVQQHFYQQIPNWPLPDGDGLWSPLMHPDLSSILNAESYHDGTPGLPAAAPRQQLKRTTDQAGVATQDQAEPPVKRPRGRPKIIVDDTEAGHRRRGQIRNAQRAYRGRREDLLVWNQKRVKEMRAEKEQMSKAFMELHDFIVNNGLLHLHQDLPQQLRTAVGKFAELAKEPDDEPAHLKAPRARKPRVASVTAAASAESAGSEGRSVSPPRGGAGAGSDSPDAPKVLFAGLIVSHEPDSDGAAQASSSAHAGNNWSQGGPSPSSALDNASYEVVSQPTAHNASFPYGMSLEAAFETGPFTSLHPDTFPPDMLPGMIPPGMPPNTFPPGMPWGAPLSVPPSLAGPSSLAHQERTFGRRLQRAALEQGIRLFNMPNPPPHFLAAVFGFCLLFETRETIVQRLTDRLSVNQQETMNNWRAPFLHLGGAGTFFEELNEMDDPLLGSNVQNGIIDPTHPQNGIIDPTFPQAGVTTQQQTAPVGNRGLAQPHRSKVAPDSMYGQGPWPAATESARDLRVDRKLRIVMPGWEGDFYDCDEIEWYLQQRGVVIPPAADVVTAEIDESAFIRDENLRPVKAFDATIDNTITDWLMRDYVQDGPGAEVAAQMATPSTSGTRSHGTPLGAFDLAHAEAIVSGQEKGADPPYVPSAAAAPSRRRVTVNVEVLVNELVSRSVCLGRTPGVRPKDVDAAFWSSVTVG